MPTQKDINAIKHGPADTGVDDLFLRRWSPRAFAETPIPEDHLKIIFTAGSWAASCNNEQPWRFLVGRKGDETWQKIFDSLAAGNQVWTKAAPVLYAGLAKKTFSFNGKPNNTAAHDLGAASATIALQATRLGYQTHGMAGFNAETLISSFAIPTDFEPFACWAMGTPGDPDVLSDKYKEMEYSPRKRKAIGEVVFSKWDVSGF